MSACKLSTYTPESNGYVRVRVKGVRYLHHRLVYMEAHGLTPQDIEGKIVMHTCDTRNCINPEHLVLGTQSENIKDMWNKGREPEAFRQSWRERSKLTEADVRQVREQARTKQYKDVAKDYGISVSTVGDIVHGRIWKHVD